MQATLPSPLLTRVCSIVPQEGTMLPTILALQRKTLGVGVCNSSTQRLRLEYCPEFIASLGLTKTLCQQKKTNEPLEKSSHPHLIAPK